MVGWRMSLHKPDDLAKWHFLCMYDHRVSSLSLIYQLIKAQCVQLEIEFESSVCMCHLQIDCVPKSFKVKISIYSVKIMFALCTNFKGFEGIKVLHPYQSKHMNHCCKSFRLNDFKSMLLRISTTTVKEEYLKVNRRMHLAAT